MKKILTYILIGTIVSFFVFPVSFTFLPVSLNTKKMLAVVGALLCVKHCMDRNAISLTREFMGSILLALLFSLSCYFSTVVNNTSDYTYATYFSSFFTWLSAAYCVCYVIKSYHGDVSLRLIAAYMIAVAVVQCISAILIDNYPFIEHLVDSVIEQSQAFVKEKNRLYGLGASLDPAGVRFSVTLVLLAHLLCNNIGGDENEHNVLYILAFCIIVVLGNMISRTTTIGAALALGYLLIYRFFISSAEVSRGQIGFILTFVSIILVAAIIVTVLYNTNVDFHDNMRFAFEGFFNWVETGEWRTDSTDKLNAEMWVWPKDVRGWVIGTGIFGSYAYSTDVGYCRFILYCGLVGFSSFSLFFVYHAWFTSIKFKDAKFLALLLLSVTFIIWIKVATDIFFIYALLICAVALRTDECEDIPLEEDMLAEIEEDY